jgi:abnormal spindle-like microcephaly-associated protein
MAQENMIKKSQRFMLNKTLQLVLFLDAAREAHVLPNMCLFTKTASCKSSKDIIINICKNFLQGEGDIIRHLGVLGVKLNFEQTYVHEFDYNIQNLHNDLKDGVRLARLLEILTASRGLCSSLRVPPVSRLQKLHNVGICMAKVYTPTEEQPDAKCVVEGQPDKTIALLTRIIGMYDPETAGELILFLIKSVHRLSSFNAL